jgi:hypothetical protein
MDEAGTVSWNSSQENISIASNAKVKKKSTGRWQNWGEYQLPAKLQSVLHFIALELKMFTLLLLDEHFWMFLLALKKGVDVGESVSSPSSGEADWFFTQRSVEKDVSYSIR